MDIEAYCDESHPDLLSSKNPKAQFIIIGGIWIKSDDREALKKEIHALRDKHFVGGEFKWQKVSQSRIDFYLNLISWFFVKKDDIRFRCVVIDREQVDLVKFHENDQELGFYKFYYQMLHKWITDNNTYKIFCDYKSNRRRDRLHVLKRCLHYSNLSASVDILQSTRSEESVFIQLTDVLIGAVSARFNRKTVDSRPKLRLIESIEKNIGHRISSTSLHEKKFNIFKINLKGGW
ncbi:MAG: DUF3800 domain-containing protein [Thermodesulfobacteriota bacterium]